MHGRKTKFSFSTEETFKKFLKPQTYFIANKSKNTKDEEGNFLSCYNFGTLFFRTFQSLIEK